MKKFNLLFCLVLMLFTGLAAEGQAMADQMRSEGKIYVVVAVLCIIFVGISVYLFLLDRRLKRLERKSSNKES